MFKKIVRNTLTVLKTVGQCQKYPFPSLNTLNRAIPYLITLTRTIPILIYGRRTLLGPGQESAAIAYLNTWTVPRPPLGFISSYSYYYCLLQTIKRNSGLPVIEKWEAYILPNHSYFGAIEEEHFMEGIRLLSSFEKINSNFLPKEFPKDCRRVLEDLLSTNLFTVAARSPVGLRLIYFCPEIIIGGDEYSAFYLFRQLLDGLFELGWVRGSEIEHAKSELHLFVGEQRQKEVSGRTGDLVCQSTASLHSPTSLVSILGGM